MELASRCLLHRCNPGTGEFAPRWSSLNFLTRAPKGRLRAASPHLPRPTFSGPATTFNSCFKVATSFRGSECLLRYAGKRTGPIPRSLRV